LSFRTLIHISQRFLFIFCLALEELWAAKAFAYAETYERLLHAYKDLSKLKLTK